MATKLEIANRAILLARGVPIESLDETSGLARTVSTALTASIQEVVAVHEWNRLNRTLKLIPSITYTLVDSQYTYAFKLPSDYSNLISIKDVNGFNYTDFRNESGHILCNWDVIYLHYNIQVTETSDLPEYLASVIAAHVAISISGVMSADDTLVAALEGKYLRRLSTAKVADARNSPAAYIMTDQTSHFIDAHNTYGEV